MKFNLIILNIVSIMIAVVFLNCPASSENSDCKWKTGDTSWHVVGAAGEPAFQNGWSTVGGTSEVTAFRKDGQGIVLIQGNLNSGTNNTIAFTLPEGYRPKQLKRLFGVDLSGTNIRININYDGTVQVGNNSAYDSMVMLNDIIFYAE